MNLIEDSRQKIGKHTNIHKVWKENGDKMIRCKLPFGDYALVSPVYVDSKQNLVEVTGNLCGSKKEKDRFLREEKMAKDMNSKIVFLIEQEGINNKTDLLDMSITLPSGVVIPGERVMTAMDMHEAKYGSEFMFCAPSESGEKIKEILRNGG